MNTLDRDLIDESRRLLERSWHARQTSMRLIEPPQKPRRRRVNAVDALQRSKPPRGPEECAAAHTVLQLIAKNAELHRRVLALREPPSSLTWLEVLAKIT